MVVNYAPSKAPKRAVIIAIPNPTTTSSKGVLIQLLKEDSDAVSLNDKTLFKDADLNEITVTDEFLDLPRLHFVKAATFYFNESPKSVVAATKRVVADAPVINIVNDDDNDNDSRGDLSRRRSGRLLKPQEPSSSLLATPTAPVLLVILFLSTLFLY